VLVITTSTPFSNNSASRELGNCAAYPTYILQYVTSLVQDGRNFIRVQSAQEMYKMKAKLSGCLCNCP
jgi:hypothetical protein